METVTLSSRRSHLEMARQKLLDREQKTRRQNADLQRQAASDASDIVALIARQYQPRRIYQWGSLLRTGSFKPYSDIDIAIEGITDAQRFFALLGDAQKLTRFPLDIVQLEKIVPEYADDIRRHGKLVYEEAGV